MSAKYPPIGKTTWPTPLDRDSIQAAFNNVVDMVKNAKDMPSVIVSKGELKRWPNAEWPEAIREVLDDPTIPDSNLIFIYGK